MGIRLIKKIGKHYKGSLPLHFHILSDKNPFDFLPENTENVSWIPQVHASWVEATNSKFRSVIDLNIPDEEYLYYLDADTNVNRDFTEEVILGSLAGAQHFNDHDPNKPYDRYEMSKAYIPRDTPLKQMYFQGAFFGGKVDSVKRFCQILRDWQISDRQIPYEPGVNDESYINRYFHYNPPEKIVMLKDFPFVISDKGGIENQRAALEASEATLEGLVANRDNVIEIRQGQVIKGFN